MASIIRPDVSTMVANMERVWARGTTQQKFDGIQWYPIARLDIVRLAERVNLHVNVVAAVVAAVSPQTRWFYKGEYRNLRLAEAMIVAWQRGLPVVGHTGDANLKVKLILESGSTNPAELVVLVLGKAGFKTGNFYLNLLGIKRLQGVNHKYASTLRGTTTDRFHIGVSYGVYFGENVPKLNEQQYNDISTATEQFAERHGLSEEEAQAGLWIMFRHQNGVKDE